MVLLPLRLILGRAGSGKTRYCLEALAADLRRSPDGPPLILLVPEQATFQMDRLLVSLPGVRGSARGHVLSFRRLAWRVLAETGGGARPHIDEVGKAMALRVLLERRREELRVFGSVTGRPGFLRRLAETIGELRAYGICPAHLESGLQALSALGRGDTSVAGKLHDLAVIIRDLEAYLAGRWTDPDDYLTLLADRLALRPSAAAGARVWVDGFTGFTPQEFTVLGALFKVAAEVNVALCLDPDALDTPRGGASTFRPTLKTYDSLLETARLAEVGVEEPVELRGLPAPRYRRSPALAHLEASYPQGRPSLSVSVPEPGPGAGPDGPPEGITLVAAESRRAEVTAAAREMARLAREEGYRWREMSLVVRSLDLYTGLIEPILWDHDIPFFVDRRRPLSHHPLVEFIRSAVETAATDWAFEPVFRLLKTDLWPLTRDEVDLLENYALAHGIRGGGIWTREEPWRWRRVFSLEETAPPDPAAEERLRHIDGLRRRVAGLLGPFVGELRGGGRRRPVRDFAAVLWNLLETLAIPATLERWHREALEAGRPDLAQEHERVLGGVVGLLDQMVENLGDEAVDLTDFSRILEAGLETLEPGLVPPGLDQVLVGAVDRTRHPDIRACFVLGANEGVFPAVSSEDQVFSDQERDELAGLGMDLAPSSREKALTEDYLVYVALTRPSEKLWVSYARADDDGRALSPSPLVARLKALFPGLKERPSGLEPRPEELSSETEALSSVTRALSRLKKDRSAGAPDRREAPPEPSSEQTCPVGRRWLEVYNWLVGDPARLERTRTALCSVGYVNRAGPLEPDLAARMYGDPVRVSVSRLEDYAGCPFRHFASAGLALEPRRRRQLKAPEIGSYYHAVLSLFTKGLLADGADLADLTQTEISDRLRRAVEEVEPRLESEVLSSRARYRHLAGRLRRTVARTVEVLAEHARRGSFRPTGVEARFSLKAAGLWLRGFVDRLEAAPAPKGGHLYTRVIDFKSGGRSYDLRRTYHGLDVQLPTYLLAATDPTVRWDEGPARPGTGGEGPAGATPLPAGGFFFPVTDPLVSARGPLEGEDLEKERAKKVQVKGFALGDPEILRLMGASPGKDPALLPVLFKKDGTPRASNTLLSPAEMDLLLRFVRLRVRELASAILRGRVSVAPYRRGTTETACRWCDYRAVCRFDPTAGDDYRRLPWPDASEVWKLMKERVERADDA